MCTGIEIMTAASLAMAAVGTAATVRASRQTPPPVVTSDPVADDDAAMTKAAQEAQLDKLEQRRKAQANSLLSAAGAAGDTSSPDLGKPVAVGKTTFGE